ncbi:hypothetical protein DEJ49_33270 [Streptomyces venezuelae]|uniref:Uncharacterized protein n=1 Tax=Streptomyces venezuelae TaxID=54571 RepID=A0A5P2CQN2_STRVZ|nr:hypothetical protein [Streptomyces venezuelae]QES45212.1 hypothetical protein DEJ49_33270 [Streptomyces venezuelae]
MGIKTHTCLTVDCDACGKPMEDEEGNAFHFADLAQARAMVREFQWSALSCREFVCDRDDAAHQHYFDQLMPPEPVTQVHGQLDFDGNEEP